MYTSNVYDWGHPMDSREVQNTIREIVDDLISKRRGYRDFAVFLLPQKQGPDKFAVSFRVGRLDDQELSEFEFMVSGLDLVIDYEASGITEDKQRIILVLKPRPEYQKSTPEPKRVTHSRIDQETGKQEISDRHSCLSVKHVLEGVCIPSQNGRLKPRPSGRGRLPPP